MLSSLPPRTVDGFAGLRLESIYVDGWLLLGSLVVLAEPFTTSANDLPGDTVGLCGVRLTAGGWCMLGTEVFDAPRDDAFDPGSLRLFVTIGPGF